MENLYEQIWNKIKQSNQDAQFRKIGDIEILISKGKILMKCKAGDFR